MSNRLVNKAIRKIAWPALRTHGFETTTGRSAWRHAERSVEVITFRSFNAYLADQLGCTTFSFAVDLGIYFLDIPPDHPSSQPPERDGKPAPPDHLCHFRRGLQRADHRSGAISSIWYVDGDGANAVALIENAVSVIGITGLKWFRRFQNRTEVLRTLREDPEDMDGTWGFGMPDSPARNYMTGFVALALGQPSIALAALSRAIESDCFAEVCEQLEAARQSARDLCPRQ